MSETKWEYDTAKGAVLDDLTRERVADVYDAADCAGPLLAAAPELYTVLESLLECMTVSHRGSYVGIRSGRIRDLEARYHRALLVLAKARGEAPTVGEG